MSEIDPEERESILEDLEDLDPRGYKGVVIACTECGQDHYYGWDMLKESLDHIARLDAPVVLV